MRMKLFVIVSIFLENKLKVNGREEAITAKVFHCKIIIKQIIYYYFLSSVGSKCKYHKKRKSKIMDDQKRRKSMCA